MAILQRIVLKVEIKDWRGKGRTYFEAVCEQCGRKFYPNRSTAKYCSRLCNDMSNKGFKYDGELSEGPAKKTRIKNKAAGKTQKLKPKTLKSTKTKGSAQNQASEKELLRRAKAIVAKYKKK